MLKPWRNLTISIGLVSVPVAIAPAFNDGSGVRGKRLCPNHHPVSQRWYCDVCDVYYAHMDTVIGYDTGNGYTVPDRDQIAEKAGVERSPVVTIESFVNASDIDPAFYEAEYLVWPQSDANASGFDLLTEMIHSTGKAAVGVATLTNRERMVVIRWSNLTDGLMFHVCRYLSDLRVANVAQITDGRKQRTRVAQDHLRWGKSLVKTLTAGFDPSVYTDEYARALVAELQADAAQKPRAKKPAPPPPDIIEQIKATMKTGAKR